MPAFLTQKANKNSFSIVGSRLNTVVDIVLDTVLVVPRLQGNTLLVGSNWSPDGLQQHLLLKRDVV